MTFGNNPHLVQLNARYFTRKKNKDFNGEKKNYLRNS